MSPKSSSADTIPKKYLWCEEQESVLQPCVKFKVTNCDLKVVQFRQVAVQHHLQSSNGVNPVFYVVEAYFNFLLLSDIKHIIVTYI